ncbi:MAG: bifunctional riboflavin kinase/FAD synthetase, partial [Acidimicrobiia bacterium]|nr:bifunctional riboflavin kinase/FAD synthetase [Acidimicrobiia bacterium]
PSAVAIGVFDGVHRGHLAVLSELTSDGLDPAVLTFDPHPLSVISAAHAPLMLTPLARKLELFERAGVCAVGVVTFDEAVRAMSPSQFCSDIVVDGMTARRVVVGTDFHFGKDRSGTTEVLVGLGEELGFEVVSLQLVGDGEAISSSAIRAAVADGRVRDAADLLGRPFRVTRTVVRGEDRGAAMGFPTANLEALSGLAIPGRGVYAVSACVEGEIFPAVANVGVRPTFGGGGVETIEVHLLDHSRDLYGLEMSVDFVERIRDEMAFSGVAELVAQIGHDVEAARRIHTS